MSERKLTSTDILSKVSRSFALCIPMLDENKKVEVENQYLLARLIDTIEDSNHTLEDKRNLMDNFFNILISEPYNNLEDLLEKLREKVIDEHDKVLIDNFDIVLNTFRLFDDSVKEMSLEWLMKMGSGMLLFQEKQIQTFDDLNQYCYYVAGTIGCYLTNLVKLKDNVELDIPKAINFGRYLQKVNIIKDFLKDQEEGRNFWPRELYSNTDITTLLNNEDAKAKRLEILEKMITNAIEERKPTFDYIISIPNKLKGYRRFCQIPAIMATETLKKMKDNDEVFTNKKGVKISKFLFYKILLYNRLDIYTKDKLKKYFI